MALDVLDKHPLTLFQTTLISTLSEHHLPPLPLSFIIHIYFPPSLQTFAVTHFLPLPALLGRDM
jgi:hypothetical protein